MTTKTLYVVRTATPLLCAALLANPVASQQKYQFGSFAVTIQADSVTGQDRSFAMLKPEGAGDALEGAVLWACGGQAAGFSAGVRLEVFGDAGDTRSVAWRFDHEAADTLVLEGEDDSALWYLHDHDLAAVTARAHRASVLTVQMPGPPARGPYRYALAGLDSVLHRLGCAAAPALARPSAGRETLRSIPQLMPVTELPRPANVADLRRALMRNYPPELRDAGVEGEVVVKFRVLEDGSVDSASVQAVRSTDDRFNDAAIRSVRQLRFWPARVYERVVKVWVQLPIQFNLPRAVENSPPPG